MSARWQRQAVRDLGGGKGDLNPNKLRLARLFDATGMNAALLRLQALLWPAHIRIVNYHDVPPSRAAAFEDQLRFLARHFSPVDQGDLLDLLAGRWRHDRPGVLISFDDGFRSNFDVAAPLLEKHGFAGWFFVPAAFAETPEGLQREFAERNRLAAFEGGADGRIAMTWDEIRELDRRHVVGCHTMNHRRLEASLDAAALELEVPDAKRLLEERLGREVDAFCWVGGEEWAYSGGAARAVRRAGFRLGFMTNNAIVRPGCHPLQLQRTNLESHFPPYLTRFQLCGFLDLTYLPKRRRVNRLTAPR